MRTIVCVRSQMLAACVRGYPFALTVVCDICTGAYDTCDICHVAMYNIVDIAAGREEIACIHAGAREWPN